jgi:menaquinone-dependent protoporphyrinogen oxidase
VTAEPQEPEPKPKQRAKRKPKLEIITPPATEPQTQEPEAQQQPEAAPLPEITKRENKTLVAYTTKGGATGEAANLIAETLREISGFQVDLVDLRKQPKPDIANYDNIVVGAGVRKGKVYEETSQFMNQDFTGKRLAVFVCSGAGGDPRQKDAVAEKYITKGLARKISPISIEAFGGCIKILGLRVVDRRDAKKIRAWAEDLGKKLAQ